MNISTAITRLYSLNMTSFGFLTIILSTILCKYFELPVMNLRDSKK